MIIRIAADGVEIVGADDFSSFAVDAGLAALADVGRALEESEAGTLDSTGAVIAPAFVRVMAAGDQEWERKFSRMSDFAQERGWITDEGAIRAHIENLG